jgi:hypothetical protein
MPKEQAWSVGMSVDCKVEITDLPFTAHRLPFTVYDFYDFTDLNGFNDYNGFCDLPLALSPLLYPSY